MPVDAGFQGLHMVEPVIESINFEIKYHHPRRRGKASMKTGAAERAVMR